MMPRKSLREAFDDIRKLNPRPSYLPERLFGNGRRCNGGEPARIPYPNPIRHNS
jgi:hypothetical protein